MSPRVRRAPFRSQLLLFGLCALLPLALTTSCCSVAGWAVGSALTRNDPPREVPAGTAFELHPGTRMGILLADSTHQLGTYMGRHRLEVAVYRTRYEAWRAQVGYGPRLGEIVEVTHRDHRVTRARFAGFAHRCVLLDRDGTPAPLEVADRDIRWFAWLATSDSLGWTGEQLADADLRGALPSREAILFKPAPHAEASRWFNDSERMWSGVRRPLTESLTIPRDDLEAVEIAGPRAIRTVLLVLGVAADVVIVAAAQPDAAVVGGVGGCSYSASSSAAREYPTIVPTPRDYDLRWGAYLDAGPLAGEERAAPHDQDFAGSDRPSLPISPPAAMPRNDHTYSTTPTPAP